MVFSQTAARGLSPIEMWGQAGLTAEWADRRNNSVWVRPDDAPTKSFKQQVLNGGAFPAVTAVEEEGHRLRKALPRIRGRSDFQCLFRLVRGYE